MKNEFGFALVETLIAVCIATIIASSFFLILNFITKTYEKNDKSSEVVQNGRFLITTMTREIRTSEKIVSSDKILGLKKKHPYNFGFVIQTKSDDNIYKYILYYMKGNKIYRDVAYYTSKDKYPDIQYFDGHNEIASYINSIQNSYIDFNSNKIILDLSLNENKDEIIQFKKEIFIRCPIDY